MLDYTYNKDSNIRNGNMLFAEPFMADENFERAVILVCEHNKSGSFGLIVNKPTAIAISDATDLGTDMNLFLGGPVEQNSMHFLHTFSDLENAIHVGDNVYWGGDFEKIHSMANMGLLNEENSRFFMGYSGWSELQLDGEVERDTWIISRLSPSVIFRFSPEELWQEALREMGGRYKMFANFPTDPSMN